MRFLSCQKAPVTTGFTKIGFIFWWWNCGLGKPLAQSTKDRQIYTQPQWRIRNQNFPTPGFGVLNVGSKQRCNQKTSLDVSARFPSPRLQQSTIHNCRKNILHILSRKKEDMPQITLHREKMMYPFHLRFDWNSIRLSGLCLGAATNSHLPTWAPPAEVLQAASGESQNSCLQWPSSSCWNLLYKVQRFI